MIILAIFFLLVAVLCLYLFVIGGRTGHPVLAELKKWNFAHRGLHDTARPENSMAAFRAALDHGYGIELDVHLMKDGNLAVIHDSNLQRVTGVDLRIEDLTAADLCHYHLNGTDHTIPLFSDVLKLFDGKAPMVVEVKCVDGNHAELCSRTLELLDNYRGCFCMESFDPRAVIWLRRNRPDICRGQLSENWMGKNLPIPGILRWALTYHISNLATRPDFISYKYADRKAFGTDICRRLLGVSGVSWTLQSREEYDAAVNEGWIPIFENFEI